MKRFGLRYEMNPRIVRFGVVGVKGFSKRHFEWIERAKNADAPLTLAAALNDPSMREISTLATASEHAAANELAFMATDIATAPDAFVEKAERDGGELYAVKEMNETLETLRPGGLLPFECGGLPWAVPGGTLSGKQVADVLARIGA